MGYEIIEGDCVDVMGGMDAESVHAVVTSPPYDNLRTYEGTCDWNQSVWEMVLEELYRVLVPGGVAVWVVGDATVNGSETGTSFAQAIYAKSVGFNIHDTMIWSKSDPMPLSHRRYEQQFEYMFVFSKGKPRVFNPIKDRKAKNPGVVSTGSVRNADGSLRPKNTLSTVPDFLPRFNIWKVPGACHKKDISGHPAPMPTSIAHDHIISWTNPGDIVLDPFAGGGTTGVACAETGRDFIGIEKVPEYADLARNRIEAAMPQGVANELAV